MHIHHLSLTNFRLYARLELDLPPGLTIIQGDNAQGKTSLLEAIYYLSTAHSPHTRADAQVIRWGASEEAIYPFAMLKADVQRRDGAKSIQVNLQKGEGARLKKDIRIDHAPKRGVDLVGQLVTVLFLPGDVDLVGGAPSLRREYLDAALSQVDANYMRALDTYTKALAQRNALLKQADERRIDPDELIIWDEQLAPAGVEIATKRREVVAALTQLAQPIHRELSNALEFLEVHYQPNFDPAMPSKTEAFQIGLDLSRPASGFGKAELVKAYRAALEDRRKDELARGMTLVGPHRDDFRFVANGIDLGEFGSRGQQRTAVLALKMAEAAWLREKMGEPPIILLDEVLAELDPHRRRALLHRLGTTHQTLITATDLNRFDADFVKQAQVLSVRGGVVASS